jgi:hypothetical protein
MRSIEPSRRAALGFVAGVVAVLIFHQGAWATLHIAGLMPPPYPMGPTPPWGVPETLNFCFWGGLWGAAYGLAAPKVAMPAWLSGLMLGVIANLVLWFVVFPLKGQPVASGWAPRSMLVVLAIHLVWGAGVGVILPLLTVRAPQRA